jgi:serine phosphatase RsbU (regulator of sigma subunit)
VYCELVGTVRTLAHYTDNPGAILDAMNVRMLARSRGGFTACLVMHVGLDGEVRLANAGLIPPYVDGREVEVENALPLGLSESAVYSESMFVLGLRSQITLLTDRVPEARSKSGELFGFERTHQHRIRRADRADCSAVRTVGRHHSPHTAPPV